MNDRVSNHPNRWKLTPVTGQTNVYDMERADDPTVAGTPLNKATFLPDATASAIEAATGASGITLPSEALDAIATALSTIGLTFNCKIGWYTWTGSGSTSASSSRSITSAFALRAFIAMRFDAYGISSTQNAIIWVKGNEGKSTSTYQRHYELTDSDTKLKWTTGTNTASDRPIYLLNESGVTYVGVAIGVKI